MKLTEILDQAAYLHIAQRFLEKRGIGSQLVNSNTLLRVRTDGDGDGVAEVWVDDGSWLIRWYQGGVQVGVVKNLTFEKCMERLQGPVPAYEAVTPGYKVHDGEAWERPISAPLIWRAIRHATEVEKKTVWSDIPGAEGEWTIRYSETQKPRMKPGGSIEDLRYFYVRVQDGHGGDNWFEIIPEDDDLLEMHPDNVGGYEITNPDGGFQT
jgi:hypothetical protein